MSRMKLIRAALMGAGLLSTASLAGCATAYYGAMEQFGIEKRQILVDRVLLAAESQEEAKEEFADALEAFRAVVDFDGGELEKTYDKLKSEYEASEREAERVRTRVKDVQIVAKDLFKEWRKELDQYESAALRADSEGLLKRTEARYDELEAKMLAASSSMDPVLKIFAERVLYLKHNLNARAISALGAESAQIEADVEKLIENMERSIAEADAFIAEMKADGAV